MATKKRRPLRGGTRAAIYVRVSSREQVQGFSLAAQERELAAFCARNGYEIICRYADEGQSAYRDSATRRPAFRKMLTDAEAGMFDVVVVHKLDRFARNIGVLYSAYGRLETAGVDLRSISSDTDFTSPDGFFMMGIEGLIAERFSRNLSEETKKGKRERKAQGVYNGLLPFGVAKGPSDIPILDTHAMWCNVATRREVIPGEGLVLAFELAAGGKSDREIAQGLTAAGYRTSGNRASNPFTKDLVRVFIRNRFYLGELPDGEGGWVPGKHGAIIDPDLFARVEAERERYSRRPKQVVGVRSPWALSGLATCSACGKPVTADGKCRARCQGRAQGLGCDQPSFLQAIVEGQISDLLGNFDVPLGRRTGLISAWKRSRRTPVDATATRGRLRSKLDRLGELYVDGDLDAAEYKTRKNEVLEQLAALPVEGTPAPDAGEKLAGYLADVSSAWAVATPAERNGIARALFTKVMVNNKTAVACVPRPDLEPFFRTLAVNPDAEQCNSGSDGGRDRVLELFAVQRVTVPGVPPFSRPWGTSSRYPAGRTRKLTHDQEAAIRDSAQSRSLRSLAVDFGVSHETVRAVLRR